MVRREPIELRTVSFIINKKNKQKTSAADAAQRRDERDGRRFCLRNREGSWIEDGLEHNEHMAPAK